MSTAPIQSSGNTGENGFDKASTTHAPSQHMRVTLGAAPLPRTN